MVLKFIDSVILLTILQLAVFSLFLFVRGVRGKKELIYLALFFFSLAVNIGSQGFIKHNEYYFLMNFTHILSIGEPFAFLYGPFAFLYITKSINNAPSRPLREIMHFIPFTLFVVYLCFNFYFFDAYEKQRRVLSMSVVSAQGVIALTIVLQAQILTYFIILSHRLISYKKKLKNQFSSINKMDFSWLVQFLVVLLFLWMIDILRFIGGIVDNAAKTAAESVLYIAAAFFCYFILFSALKQPRVFLPANQDAERAQKRNLSDLTLKAYRERLLETMDKDKPHLKPELSLSQLSETTGIPGRSLSEVIRSGGMDNFYDFINDYRVREFIDLVRRPAPQGRTVLDLMLEAGFNSKSAFNKAFKKKTGKNPGSYLRESA
jgi:AraC-like DNA-binding protein